MLNACTPLCGPVLQGCLHAASRLYAIQSHVNAPHPHPQGSTWSVRRRNYYTHDQRPPTLAAEVRPGDVPYLRPAASYAVWSDELQVRSWACVLTGRQAVGAFKQVGAAWRGIWLPSTAIPASKLPLAQELRVLRSVGAAWRLSVRGGGGHDLLTISPVGGMATPGSGAGFGCLARSA